MKKYLALAVAGISLLIFFTAPILNKISYLSERKDIKVILAYHPEYVKEAPHVLAAYESVLQEEGVPYETADVYYLLNIDAESLVKKTPAIILPDHILQNVPADFVEWTKKYMENGGNISIIYDVGVKHQKKYYLKRAAFADIAGVNYMTFQEKGIASLMHGKIEFSSEQSRDFFQIPLGKTVDRLMFSGYEFGELEYPVAKNEPVRDIFSGDIYAYTVKENEKYPLLILSNYLNGKMLYVNLPLGYMKANADDLLLRSILRTFLFDVVGMPHLMNVAAGRGALVLNWHVDSDIEHENLPRVEKAGLFREGMKASFHITAGDFLDEPGDNMGFDAAGKGEPLVKMLMNHGMIGSHGGWGHNWFAENIDSGVFGEKEIKEYIIKNNEAIEQITGYKILEYSAPRGVHPQPVTTKILEELGIIAYYYTGDTGSGPNRSFYNGKMISDKVIAFPVMPFGKVASLYEMRALAGNTDSEVKEWLFSIPDFIARNRTTRLVYSHPYDIREYGPEVRDFIDKIEKMKDSEEISVCSMTEVAQFFLRFLKTGYAFSLDGEKVVISLKNPEGLKNITVALPKNKYQKPAAEGISVQEDGKYYYLIMGEANEKEKYITVDTR